MNAWIFDEKDLRDDVKLKLPDDWKLRVFHVTSGDSGKKYWVQILWKKFQPPIQDKLPANNAGVITMCNCQQGYFQLPLSVLAIEKCCKHAEETLSFIRGRG